MRAMLPNDSKLSHADRQPLPVSFLRSIRLVEIGVNMFGVFRQFPPKLVS
jgi:hypothetical protein